MQMKRRRDIERMWEQSRLIASYVHNAGMNAKRAIQPKQVIRLSFDGRKDYPEWTQEEALELLDKWECN